MGSAGEFKNWREQVSGNELMLLGSRWWLLRLLVDEYISIYIRFTFLDGDTPTYAYCRPSVCIIPGVLLVERILSSWRLKNASDC